MKRLMAGTLVTVLAWLVAGAPQTQTMVPGPGSPITVGENPFGITTADFNRDGNLDLAVANEKSDDVSVLLGDGHGGFRAAPASPVPAGDAPNYVIAGDINEDGRPDLVAAQHGGGHQVTLLLGDGRGRFRQAPHSPFQSKISSGPHCHGIALADMNADGHLDLIALHAGAHNGRGDQSVSVLLGDGKAAFRPANGSPFALGSTPYGYAVGEVNSDGIPDLVYTSEDTQDVRTFQANGRGGFAGAPRPTKLAAGGHGVALGDFNRDGGVDLLLTHDDRSFMVLLLAAEIGSFRAASRALEMGRRCFQLTIGDFSGDGNLDAAMTCDGDTIIVLLGNGRGDLMPAAGSPFPVGKGPIDLITADFNKNKRPDIAVTNREGNSVSIYLSR